MNILSIGWNCIYGEDYIYRSAGERGVYLLVLARTDMRMGKAVLPKNTLVIYDGSCEIFYSAEEEFLVCDWIVFDADGDSEFIDIAELTFNEPIFHTDSDFISRLIRNLTAEFYSVNGRRMKMLDIMMKTLLMKAAETCSHREPVQSAAEPHYSELMELREKIYRNPQMKWNVDSMAADVSMSRSYFQHIYREIFGVSCMTDVINGKIEKAKEILSETGCTVSQVAAMCGYDNEEHFMRQFKKLVGVTPTQYRKKS